MLAALVGAAVVVGGDLRAQLRPTELPPPQTTPPDIVIGATVAQRQEAARRLVPLLKAVQTHAQPTATVRPGSVPNSPFTGTQTTLFAFTFSKRDVPVEPRVITAMNRLLDWNVGASGHEAEDGLYPAGGGAETWREAAAWAVEAGEDRRLRIVLAGYEGDWAPPAGWRATRWSKMRGSGYANATGTMVHRRETLWLSPGCLDVAATTGRQLGLPR